MAYDKSAPDRVQDADEQQVIAESRKRYQYCVAAHSENRERYNNAMVFLSGEQWDPQLKAVRAQQMRPVMTMDRLGTHVNHVVNDQRQSKPAIKVHPVDSKADVKTAEIYDGMIRHIEAISNAPSVYERASMTQVGGGQGVWRVLTRYVDDNAFEQDIFIEGEDDPMTYWFDPDAKEMTAADGMFAFVETNVPKERFEAMHPDCDMAHWPSETDKDGWYSSDSVRLAEYYRIVLRPTTLHMLEDGSVLDQSAISVENEGLIIDSRKASKREVQWFKLGGASLIDSRIVASKWIPLVRVLGNKLVVKGKAQHTGLTHRAMDPQRMYNYQTSVVVEHLQLHKTAPFVGAKGQFKGVEAQWKRMNITNPIYVEYEPLMINDQLAPPPQRQIAPGVPAGNAAAMEMAANDLQWITGQHAANMGARSNEVSGVAINARQREGDNATYHYLDNLALAIWHTGRILIDMIPKVYDTRRMLRILGEDSSAKIVEHDPQSQQSYREETDLAGKMHKIYNLGVGNYDLTVSVGPNFGTKRAESVEAMTTLLSSNKELTAIMGDIYLANQDWPGAQEAATRMKKQIQMNMPGLIEDEEDDGSAGAKAAKMQHENQQLQQALQQAQQLIDQASQEIEELQAKADDAATKVHIAELKRDEVVARAQADVEVAQIEANKDVAVAEREAIAATTPPADQIATAESMQPQADPAMMNMLAQIAAHVGVAMPNQEAEKNAAVFEQMQQMQATMVDAFAQMQQTQSDALAQLAAALANKPSLLIDFRKGDDGRIAQAVIAQEAPLMQ